MSETNIMWLRQLKEKDQSNLVHHILVKSDQGTYNYIVTQYYYINIRFCEMSSVIQYETIAATNLLRRRPPCGGLLR